MGFAEAPDGMHGGELGADLGIHLCKGLLLQGGANDTGCNGYRADPLCGVLNRLCIQRAEWRRAHELGQYLLTLAQR
jgi:hypothetical protein